MPNAPTSQVVTAYLARSRTLVFSYQPVLRATYRELKHYATSPCPGGVTARCYIERNRSGSKMLAPYYSICADLEDGTGRELVVCRKVMRSRSPHYIFSLKAEDLWRKREQRSRLYLGKLRAVGASDYILYDNGICEAPEEADSLLEDREKGVNADTGETSLARKMARDVKSAGAEDVSLYRSELMALHFNTKQRPPQAGQRGTEICLPLNFSLDCSGANNVLGKPMGATSASSAASTTDKSPPVGVRHPTGVYNITKPFEKIRQEGTQNQQYSRSAFCIHERTSRYDPLSSCLVDFKGRANMASIKNCQFVVSEPLAPGSNGSGAVDALLKQDAEKDFVLQLGKTTDDCFNMDYRYPLSLLQAFAICIARFDAKLTW
ncbi:tubby C-terminal-like domain-containing protein [Ochromonadaceae sp. CCMP2298]|nr:tubby C-terminal-like domain-containing protein [Ochromonadaceae sp. CCMP2298]